MKKIFKYVLPFQEVAIIKMPKTAHIIRVDGINGQIYVWATVDPDEEICDHTFYLYKTGMPMPDDINENYEYLGCGGIVIMMELMMYVYKKKSDVPTLYEPLSRWTGFPKIAPSTNTMQ